MNAKPNRGTCATCQWWEFSNIIRAPSGDEVRNGVCMANPPTPVMVAAQVPGSSLRPSGPQVMPAIQGMLPPITEHGRCRRWQAAGTMMEIDHVNKYATQ
jgi:hypothetical protein